MEDQMFLDCFGCDVDYSLGKNFADFADQFSKDSRYRTELYKLRRKFMSHADGLIHADLHTSNIMASRDKMKVIDMEFAFIDHLVMTSVIWLATSFPSTVQPALNASRPSRAESSLRHIC